MRRVWAIVSVLVVALGFVPSSAATGSSVEAKVPFATSEEQFLDVRTEVARSPLASAVAAARALSSEVSDAQVTWNTATGTAKMVWSDAGLLSSPVHAPVERVARAWIAEHAALFGLSPAGVASLRMTRDATLPGSGMHPLVFRQYYGDVPTFDGGTIGVNVMPDGRILEVWADTGVTGALRTVPRISAADALRAIARFERAPLSRVSLQGQRAAGDHLAIFDAGGLFGPHNVRLVVMPFASGPRLAWRVFFAKSGTELLSTAVDALSGQVLFRHNQVNFEEGQVYRNYPGAKHGGTQETVSFDGDPAVSPQGWVGLPLQGQTIPTASTFGNNVFAFTDWTFPKFAGAGFAPALALAQLNPAPDTAPIAPDGRFDYPFANNWGGACTPVATLPAVPVEGAYTVNNPSYVQDREPSVTNVFYLANTMHDQSYKVGFNEQMGNFQFSNFGKGGKELDPVRILSMAGIVRGSLDNAFMFTPADGGEPTQFVDASNPTKIENYIPPFSAMFLWRSVPGFEAPCVDGDQDATVEWHEYTHGITNRTVGGPDDADALGAQQSGSMGEAWSDWFALHFLHQQGLETDAIEGKYATGNPETGIRNFALDKSPLTYADFGYDRTGPEVHADGEIWADTLWELRTALINRYGKIGADQAGKIVYAALALAPRLPSFLNMRDAILQAAKIAALPKALCHNSARPDCSSPLPLIWSVFAHRGMGKSAFSKDGNDTHPRPAFDLPSGNGTLTGRVTDADGGVLKGARITLGFGEGSALPVAVTKADGSFSIPVMPGTFPLTVGGPGYALQPQGKITITAGKTLIRDVVLYKNLASIGYGATVQSGLAGGDPGVALIDDHEYTQQLFTAGTPVVIKLGGNGPVSVHAVSVAPRSRSVLRAPTKFTLELSADGHVWKKVLGGGVRATKPRPRVQDAGRVFVTLPHAMQARYARLTASSTVGNADPATVAGVQVFANAPGLAPKEIGGEADVVQPGTITLSNAAGDSASITLSEFQTACDTPPPPVQGLDSYIWKLPDNAGDGVHNYTETNKGGTATDIDNYFYAADCNTGTGQIATGAASEAGPIPLGSKWVQVVLYAGTTDGFDLKVSTTLERAITPVQVAGRHIVRKPGPSATHLPSTGVGTRWLLALMLLVAAAGVRMWIMRRA